MKHITLLILSLSLSLSSCLSVTETRPDGTVIKTQGIDRDAVIATSEAVTTLGGVYLTSQAQAQAQSRSRSVNPSGK